MSPRPSISVIIPAFNRTAMLLQAIDSLAVQMREGDEIIVVDDGSTEDTAAQAERQSPFARVIRQEHTANLCQVRNRGAQEAKGGILMFLDSDDLATPGRIDLQAGLLASDQGYDVAVGAQWRFSGEAMPDLNDPAIREPADPAVLAGTVASTMAAFRQVGPFNEAIRAYEYGEWILRAEACGLRILKHRDVVMLRRSHNSGHMSNLAAYKDERMVTLKRMLDQRRSQSHAGKT